MAKSYAWYVCRACRSRLAVEREHTGEIRCRNCSTLIRAAVATAAPQRDEDDDEYRLAPSDVGDRLTSGPTSPTPTPPPIYGSEPEKLRARRDRVQPPVAATLDAAPKSDESPLKRFTPRDDQRYAPAAPPRWTFFSGVLTYPWRPQSILPWVVLSLGLALCEVLGLVILGGLFSGTKEGAVMAGFAGLAWFWLLILTGSYAAACVVAVTETTAYNYDAPYDWPDPDWRERFMHLLWFAWCLGLAAAFAIIPTVMVDETQTGTWTLLIGTGVLLPIVLLSTLETNSLSPFSPSVWGSLITEGVSWLLFYVLTSVLVGGCGIASVWLFRRLGMLSVLVTGPLWAACILIYARLLGRLAWQIMQPGHVQLQAWRKAHESTLAGEERQRRREENPFEEESRA